MFEELPQREIVTAGTAFLVGWVVAKLGSLARERARAWERDPRDDRIRSLDAELRIAQSGNENLKTELEEREQDLAEARKAIAQKKDEAGERDRAMDRLREDLKDSVRKTRELRAEVSERAEQALRLEARMRELETELSVAQSSPNLMASSLLDYGAQEDGDEAPEAVGKTRAAR